MSRMREEISPDEVDVFRLLKVNPTLARIALAEIIPKYLEYPPGNRPTPYVIHQHSRGRSQHYDLRLKADGYLLGWTIVGFSADRPATMEYLKENIGKGMRAETKGRQPSSWLKVEGIVRPGEVGAGVEAPGRFIILSSGEAIFGSQKTWLHEYFLKDDKEFKDWTRILFRAIRVPKIDPETKRAIPKKYETMWRFMIPKDPMPYAIGKRAIKVGWKPKKDIVPFPEEWTKKSFPREYARWKEFMGKERARESLGRARFAILEHSWRGAFHIRGLFRREYHFLLDDGKDRVMDFRSEESPLFNLPVALVYEGRIARKWMDYEGELKPMEHWNPNKELPSRVKILLKGGMDLRKEVSEDRMHFLMNVPKGPFRGGYSLLQEEKASPFHHLDKIKSLAREGFFVLDSHTIDSKTHYDIRYRISGMKDYLWELSGMKKSPLELDTEEPVAAIRKRCEDLSWIDPKFKKGEKKVGAKITQLKRIDQGSVQLLEENPSFVSYWFRGERLKGYWIARETPRGYWLVMKSRLPTPLELATGNPRTGDYFKPFRLVKKKGWNYFDIEIYDEREFTRAETREKTRRYLPDLAIPEEVDLFIGIFTRIGKIHGARVFRARFPEEWEPNRAIRWIKDNKLHLWQSDMIREAR